MRILLLRPPIVSRNPRALSRISTGIPIGLLSVAAAAEAAGHRVTVFDAVVEFDIEAQHADLQTLKAGEREAEIHFGASWDTIREVVAERRPRLVGIGNQYSDSVDEALAAAAVVKGVDPAIVTVVGGPHATVSPETFIFPDSPVDYAVIGEGEKVFVDLAGNLERGDPPEPPAGVAALAGGRCRSSAQSRFIEDLDSLPVPAYHLVDMEKYFLFETLGYQSRISRATRSSRSVSVVTSRGCPYRCVFCSIHVHMGRRWRPNSAGHVLAHLGKLVREYGAEHVHFEDDNLTVDRKRFNEILDGKRDRGLRFTWDTPNGVRADALDRDVIAKCKESGCLMLAIGVESGVQRVLDEVVGKRLDLAKVDEVARLCHEMRLDLYAFFVIGMPGETRAEIVESTRFALRLARLWDIVPAVSIAKPLVGTEMHRICAERGYLTAPVSPSESRVMWEQDIGMRPMIRTAEFDLADLETIYVTYYKELVKIFRNRLILGMIASPVIWGKCLALAADAVRKHGLGGLSLVRRDAAALYWDRVYGPAR